MSEISNADMTELILYWIKASIAGRWSDLTSPGMLLGEAWARSHRPHGEGLTVFGVFASGLDG